MLSSASSKRVRRHRLRKQYLNRLRFQETDNSTLEMNPEIISIPAIIPDISCRKHLHCDEQQRMIIDQNDPEERLENISVLDQENVDFDIAESDSDESVESDNLSSNSSSESEEEVHCDIDEEEPEIYELRKWSIESKIPKKHLDTLLKILRSRLLPSLPSCSKTFLSTGLCKYKIESMTDTENHQGEYVFLGIESTLKLCVNPRLHTSKVLELDFNIDGVKIKKSSPKTMWPILCRVFYEPKPIIYKPFSIAIFYGHGKPKNIDQYLEKFIIELNGLIENGIIIKAEKYFVKIRSFICDTPARAAIKCIKGHSSFNGCERCDCVGQKSDNTTVYLSVGTKRTKESFREFVDADHHNGVSPLILIKPEVDLVNQFILDSMHLLFLGVMLRILENLMTNDSNVRLSSLQKKELIRRTTMLKNDMPKEFLRKLRPINFYDKYKAVEHRFILLYCGPIILKKILSNNLYDHFLLLHVACRILSSKEAVTYATIADDYLKEFVKKSVDLYGPKFVTLNVHNLNHIADDVRNMGCNVSDVSALPFENELGKIKNILLSPHNTLAQYCRRIHEERQVLDQMAEIPQSLQIMRGKSRKRVCIKYNEQYYSSKHPDSTALLKNGAVVNISEILIHPENITLKVKKYKKIKSVYARPCDSASFNIIEIENIHSNNLTEVSLDCVQSKLVKISINFNEEDPKRSFVLPLLH